MEPLQTHANTHASNCAWVCRREKCEYKEQDFRKHTHIQMLQMYIVCVSISRTHTDAVVCVHLCLDGLVAGRSKDRDSRPMNHRRWHTRCLPSTHRHHPSPDRHLEPRPPALAAVQHPPGVVVDVQGQHRAGEAPAAVARHRRQSGGAPSDCHGPPSHWPMARGGGGAEAVGRREGEGSRRGGLEQREQGKLISKKIFWGIGTDIDISPVIKINWQKHNTMFQKKNSKCYFTRRHHESEQTLTVLHSLIFV